MTVILQRSVMPLSIVGILLFATLGTLHELRTPAGFTLLGATALLFALRPIEREIRSNLQFKKRVLVIGRRPIARRFLEEIERHPERGYTIVGVVDETASDSTNRSPFLVLGTIDALPTIVAAVKPNLIVVALSDRRGRMPVEELLRFQSEGIRVEDVADAYERISGKLPIEIVTPGQLIASQQLRKSRLLKAIQRAVSLCAAVVLLLLCAPLLAMIAIAIIVDSGGPVFFRQTRLGKGCRPFHLTKFRTMLPVARPRSEWVCDNSERITRVGKWLRRLRLDELPQLVNVIRGDMNLVGPRPHPVGNLELFREAIPYYMLRGSIRPGITGWAQVRYHYANNLEEETEKMRYDLYYIKHMSLLLDASIILKTCAVFMRSLRSSIEAESTAVTTLSFAAGPARLHIKARSDQQPSNAAAFATAAHDSRSLNRELANH